MQSKIMIVDDEEDTVGLIRTLLKKEGYDVVTASSASECLRKLKGDEIDLILLDILMPETSGRDLCIKLRKNREPYRGKIIYLSVMEPLEYRKKYGKEDLQKLNISDYITKPFDNRDLIRRVGAILA
ncbi:MAG: two-component system response regulator [Candidatus Altiarchaeales archaeon ex4484_43]|nr:MAG: two-component system response regulator [Candidatus Altiarchaeales archaeon ex4484_43]